MDVNKFEFFSKYPKAASDYVSKLSTKNNSYFLISFVLEVPTFSASYNTVV